MKSKFLHSLSEMIFSGAAEENVRQQLRIVAYGQYTDKIAQLAQERAALAITRAQSLTTKSKKILSDIGSPELRDRNLAIQRRIDEIDAEQKMLTAKQGVLAEQIGPDNIHTPAKFDDKFIDEYAKKFNQVDSLTRALSDAPEALRKHLPDLYSKIFLKMDKAEQEAQIAQLCKECSKEDIKNILDVTIEKYNMPNQTPKERLKCQELVHMIVFEMAQQSAAKVQAAAAPNKPDYNKRQTFLKDLIDKIPDVKNSDILDSLGDYQSSKGQTLSNVLYRVDEKLHIDSNSDYGDEGAELLASLQYKLRFGRAQLRGYVDHITQRTANNIFFGRDLRDLALFTSKKTDQKFQDLEVMRVLDSRPKLEKQKDYSKTIEQYSAKKTEEQSTKKTEQQSTPTKEEKKAASLPILKQFTDVLGAFKLRYTSTDEETPEAVEKKELDEARDKLAKKEQASKSKITTLNDNLNNLTASNNELELLQEKLRPILKIVGNLDLKLSEHMVFFKSLIDGIKQLNPDRKKDKDRDSLEQAIQNSNNIDSFNVTERVRVKNLLVDIQKEVKNYPQKYTDLMSENIEKNKQSITKINEDKKLAEAAQKELIRTADEKRKDIDSRLRECKAKIALFEKNKKIYSEFKGKSDDSKPRNDLVDELLETLNQTINISHSKSDGQITIDFFYVDKDKVRDNVRQRIENHGGFGIKADTLTGFIVQQNDLTQENAVNQKFTGRSLTEIKNKIETELERLKDIPGTETKQRACESYLKALVTTINACKPRTIPSLELGGAAEELLLRKLLDLQIYYQVQPELLSANLKPLEDVFKKLTEGDYRAAIKTPEVAKLVEVAFEDIARVDLSKITDVRIQEIVEKVQTVVSSAQKKESRLAEYNAVWTDNLSPSDRVTKLIDIFEAEYKEMQPSLKLSDTALTALNKDIRTMAEDLVRLNTRIANGEPILTPEEQKAYFDAISSIQAQIAPRTLSDVSFKIKHSLEGPQIINVTDKDDKPIKGKNGDPITVQLDVKIPYSINKFPGECECMFSFGGSRGNVAPFEGLEEAYGKKGRYFTASRLLGEGQYGAVKLAIGLLSSALYAIKKGMTSDAFMEEARQNPAFRAITSRQDPLAQSEAEATKRVQESQQDENKRDASSPIIFTTSEDKEREEGELFKQKQNKVYMFIAKAAPGSTYADLMRKATMNYTKGDPKYHNPLLRGDATSKVMDELATKLAMVEAVVGVAQKFEGKASHNDIKPENFLLNKRADGTYEVNYIDWATQGYKAKYELNEGEKPMSAEALFKKLYGEDEPITEKDGIFVNSRGQFVQETADGIYFGVSPHLQVLHGARNCTVSYISPDVVWKEGEAWESQKAGVTNTDLDTVIQGNDPRMDDWALTAMAFGICNRKAYFALASGRAVSDYVVPGVLVKNAKNELSIEDPDKFNDFFACDDSDKVTGEMKDDNKHAVMYIPSNQREGEPFHLYRLLKEMKKKCMDSNDRNQHMIAKDIDKILQTAHKAIASGKGLSKVELQAQLKSVNDCKKRFERTLDANEQVKLQQAEKFNNALETCKNSTIDQLLIKADGSRNYMDILCTYPSGVDEQQKALTILTKTVTDQTLHDKFLTKDAPCSNLFQECVEGKQSLILSHLLSKVVTPKSAAAFKTLVANQGLLHLAMQEKLTVSSTTPPKQTEVASLIVDALKRTGVNDKEIFDLMVQEYGSGPGQKTPPKGLQRTTNAFNIAIENNNQAQLALLLQYLPDGNQYDEQIKKALHLAASLARPELFNQILAAKTPPYSMKDILSMTYPPDNTSPYHLFLAHENTTKEIPWDNLAEPDNKALASSFLRTPPPGTKDYPCLIAAEHENIDGLKKLFDLANNVLNNDEKKELFKQTDEHGKNLLNHILEKNKVEYLPQFIQELKKACGEDSSTILLHLLTNANPVDPLKNLLATTASSEKKFELIGMLLDGLGKNEGSFPAAAQQKARLVTLLMNRNWLISQAKDPKNKGMLHTLLRNNALENTNQQCLCKILADQCKKDSDEEKMFLEFFNEVMPGDKKERALRQDQLMTEIPELLEEVNLHRADAGEFVVKFVPDEQKTLGAVDVGVKELDAKLMKLNKELVQNKSAADVADSKLTELTRQLDLKTEQCKQLEKKILADLANFQQSYDKLALNNNLSVQEKEAVISRLTATHETEKNALLEVNESYIEDIKLLTDDIRTKRIELEEKQSEYDNLNSNLEGLRQNNLELSQRVGDLTVDNEAQQKALAAQKIIMDQSIELTAGLKKKVAGKALHIELLIARGSRLNDQNNTLSTRVSELESKNQQLTLDVQKLDSSLTQTQAELSTARGDLTISWQTATDLRIELQKLTVENSNLSNHLTQANQSHDAAVKELEKKQADEISKLVDKGAAAVQTVEDQYAKKFLQLKAEHETNIAPVKADLEKAQKKIEELSTKELQQNRLLDAANNKVTDLERELDGLRVKNSDLSTGTDALNERIREQQQMLSDGAALVTSLRAEIGGVQEENITFHQELSTLKKVNEGLSKEVQSLTLRVSALEQEVIEANRQLGIEKDYLKTARLETTDLTGKLTAAQSDNDALRQQITSNLAAYEVEITRLTSEHANADKAQKAELSGKIDALTLEHTAERTKLLGSLQKSDEKINGLNNEISALTSKLGETQGRVELLDGQMRKLQSENQQLKENAARDSTTALSLQEKIEKQQNLLENSVQSINGLRTDNLNLVTANSGLTDRVEHLQLENKRLKSDLSGLEQKVEQLVSQNENITRELTAATIQFKESDAQRENLQRELEEKTRQHEELKQNSEDNLATYTAAKEALEKQLTTAKEKASSDVATLEQRISTLTSEHKDKQAILNLSLSTAADTILGLKGSVDALTNNLNEVNNTVVSLRSDMLALKVENSALLLDASRKAASNTELNHILLEQKSKLEISETLGEDLERKLTSAQDTNFNLEANVSRLQTENVHLLDDNLQLQEQVSRVQNEAIAVNQSLHAAENTVQEHLARISRLETSLSKEERTNKDLSQQIEVLSSSHSKELEELRQQHTKELDGASKTHLGQFNELVGKHEAAIQKLTSDHTQEKTELLTKLKNSIGISLIRNAKLIQLRRTLDLEQKRAAALTQSLTVSEDRCQGLIEKLKVGAEENTALISSLKKTQQEAKENSERLTSSINILTINTRIAEEKNSNLEDKNGKLIQQISNLEDKVLQLETAVGVVSIELREANAKLATSNGEVERLSKALVDKTSQHLEVKTVIEVKSKEFESAKQALQEKIDAGGSQVASLELEKTALIDAHHQEQQRLNQQLSSAEQSISDLQKNISEANGKLLEEHQKVVTLTSKITILEDQNTALQGQVNDQKGDNTELRRILLNQTKEIAATQDNVNQLEVELNGLTQTNKELGKEVATLRGDNESLQIINTSLTQQMEALKLNVQFVAEQLESQKLIVQGSAGEVKELRADLSEKEAINKTLQEKIQKTEEEYKAKIEQLGKENAEALAQAGQKGEVAVKELEALQQARITQLTTEHQATQQRQVEQLNESTQDVQRLRAEIQGLNLQLTAQTASMSALNERYSVLEARNTTLEKQLMEKTGKDEKITQVVSALSAALGIINDGKTEVGSLIDGLKSGCETLIEKTRGVETENDKLKNEIYTLQQEKTALQEEVKQVQATLKEAQLKLQEQTDLVQQTSSTLVETKRLLEAATSNANDQLKTIEHLQTEFNSKYQQLQDDTSKSTAIRDKEMAELKSTHSSELAALRENLAGSISDKDELINKLALQTSIAEKSEATIVTLTSEITDIKEKNQSLMKIYEQAVGQNALDRTSIEEKDLALAAANQALLDLQQANSHSLHENEGLRTELSQLHGSLTKLTTGNEQLIIQVDALNANVSASADKVAGLEAEARNKDRTIEELTSDIANIRTLLSTTSAAVSTGLEDLTGERNNVNQLTADTNTAKAQHANNVKEIEEKIQLLQLSNDEGKKLLETEKKRYLAENTELSGRLNTSLQNVARLEEEASQREKRLFDQQSQINALTENNHSLIATNKQLQDEIQQITQSNEQTLSLLRAQAVENKELKENLSVLQRENTTIKDELKLLKEAFIPELLANQAAQTAQIEAYQKQIQAVKASIVLEAKGFEGQLAAYKSRVQETADQFAKEESNLKSSIAELELVNQQAADIRVAAKQLQQTYLTKVQEIRQQIKDLMKTDTPLSEQEKKTLQQQHLMVDREYEKDKSQLIASLKATERRAKELNSSVMTSQRDVEHSLKETERLRDQIVGINNTNSHLKERLLLFDGDDPATKANHALIEKIETEAKTALDIIGAQERTLKQYQSDYGELAPKVAGLTTKNEEVAQVLLDISGQADKSKQIISDLIDVVKTKVDEVDQLREQLVSTEKELKTSRDVEQKLLNDIEQQERVLSTLESTNKTQHAEEQAKLTTLSDQLQTNNAKVAMLSEKFTSQIQALSDSKQDVEVLRGQLQQSIEKNTSLEQQLKGSTKTKADKERLEATIGDQKTKIRELELSLNRANKDKESLINAVKRETEAKNKVQKESKGDIHSIRVLLNEANQKLQARDATIANLGKKLTTAQEQYTSALAKVEELRKNSTQLETAHQEKVRDITGKLQSAEQGGKDAGGEITRLKDELQAANEAYAVDKTRLVKELNDSQSSLNSLLDVIKIKDQEIRLLQVQMPTLKGEMEQVIKERDALKLNLAGVETKNKGLSEKVDQSVARYLKAVEVQAAGMAFWRGKYTDLVGQVNDLMRTNDSSLDTIRTLNEKIVALEQQTEATAKQLEASETRALNAAEALKQTEEKLDLSKQSEKNLTEKVVKLQEAHDEKVHGLYEQLHQDQQQSVTEIRDLKGLLEAVETNFVNEINELRKQLDDATQTNKTLSQQLIPQSVELERAIIEKGNLGEQLQEVQEKNKVLEAELSTSKEASDSKISELTSQLQALTVASNASKSGSDEKIAQLQQEIELLTTTSTKENTALRQNLASQKTVLDAAFGKIQTLTGALNAQRARAETLEKELNKQKTSFDKSIDEVSRLTEVVGKQQIKITSLEDQHRTDLAKLKKLEGRVASMTSELASRDSKIQTLKGDLVKSQKQYQAASRQVTTLQTRCQNLDNEYNEKVKDLNTQLAAAKGKTKSAEGKTTRSEEEITQLTHQLSVEKERYSTEKNLLAGQLSNSEREVALLSDNLVAKTAEIEFLNAGVNILKGKVDGLIDENNRLGEENTELRSSTQEMQRKIAGQQSTLDQLFGIQENLILRVNELALINQQAASRIRTLEEQVTTLSTSVDDMSGKLKESQVAAAEAIEQLNGVNKQLEQSQESEKQLLNQIEALEASHKATLSTVKKENVADVSQLENKHQQALIALHNKLKPIQQNNQILIDKLHILEGKLAASEKNVDALQSRLKTAESTNRTLSEKLAKSKSNVETLQVKLKTLNQKTGHLESTIGQLRKESRDAKGEAQKLTVENEALSQQVGSLTGDVSRMKEEAEEVKQKIGQKDQQIETLTQGLQEAQIASQAAEKKATDLEQASKQLTEQHSAKVKALEAELEAARAKPPLNVQTPNTDDKIKQLEEDLRRQKESFEKGKRALLSKNNRVIEQRKFFRQKIRAMNTKLSARQREIMDLRQNGSQLESQLTGLNSQLELAQQKNTDLIAQGELNAKQRQSMQDKGLAIVSQSLEYLKLDILSCDKLIQLEACDKRLKAVTGDYEYYNSAKSNKDINVLITDCTNLISVRTNQVKNPQSAPKVISISTQTDDDIAPAPAPAPAPAQKSKEEDKLLQVNGSNTGGQEKKRTPAGELPPLKIWVAPLDFQPKDFFTKSGDISIKTAAQVVEHRDIKTAAGMDVTSPSGQKYNIKMSANNEPHAVLSKKSVQPSAKESRAQHQKRVATTIINMIDNVLAHSDSVNIKTEDPFIAETARQYLDYLKKNGNESITFKVDSTTDNSIKQDEAKTTFELIKPAVTEYLTQKESAQAGQANPHEYRKQFKAELEKIKASAAEQQKVQGEVILNNPQQPPQVH